MSGIDPLTVNQNRAGRVENFPTVTEFATDDLGERVREAVLELAESGRAYCKSKDVAKVFDLEADVSNHRRVGKRLEALSLQDDPVVEKWSPGNGQRTWRIIPEEAW